MKRKYIANARLFVTNEIASHVQLSEKPLQIFLCLLLTFLNDFFVTLLWLFLASFSSLFCHLLTFLNDFFVIALCSYFSPFSSFLSLTHFSEYFLCYELQDHRRWNDYSNLSFMEADEIDWCSLSNRVFLQGKEFTRRNWLWERMIFHS